MFFDSINEKKANLFNFVNAFFHLDVSILFILCKTEPENFFARLAELSDPSSTSSYALNVINISTKCCHVISDVSFCAQLLCDNSCTPLTSHSHGAMPNKFSCKPIGSNTIHVYPSNQPISLRTPSPIRLNWRETGTSSIYMIRAVHHSSLYATNKLMKAMPTLL